MADESTKAQDDFFAGLADDHARIEARLKEFDRAADAIGRATDDAAALEVIAGTLRFFATEGARHEAHEERTLFPRLRSRPEFTQILSALRFQHQMNDTAGRELAAGVARFAPGRGRELCRLAIRFAELHRAHAVAEELTLFPLATSVLPPEVVAAMGREMRERNEASRPTGDEAR